MPPPVAIIALAQSALHILDGGAAAAGHNKRPLGLGAARSEREIGRSLLGDLLLDEPGVRARAVLLVERDNALERPIPLGVLSAESCLTARWMKFGRRDSLAPMDEGGLFSVRCPRSLDNTQWH